MVTDKEWAILDAIAHHLSNAQNGIAAKLRNAEETATFAHAGDFARYTKTSVQSARGCLSSLQMKRLIVINHYDDNDNALQMTDEGFNAWQRQSAA